MINPEIRRELAGAMDDMELAVADLRRYVDNVLAAAADSEATAGPAPNRTALRHVILDNVRWLQGASPSPHTTLLLAIGRLVMTAEDVEKAVSRS